MGLGQLLALLGTCAALTTADHHAAAHAGAQSLLEKNCETSETAVEDTPIQKMRRLNAKFMGWMVPNTDEFGGAPCALETVVAQMEAEGVARGDIRKHLRRGTLGTYLFRDPSLEAVDRDNFDAAVAVQALAWVPLFQLMEYWENTLDDKRAAAGAVVCGPVLDNFLDQPRTGWDSQPADLRAFLVHALEREEHRKMPANLIVEIPEEDFGQQHTLEEDELETVLEQFKRLVHLSEVLNHRAKSWMPPA